MIPRCRWMTACPYLPLSSKWEAGTYAVYDPNNEEFEQTATWSRDRGFTNNGPADYQDKSPTAIWMKQKTREIFRGMIKKQADELSKKVGSRESICFQES